MLLFLAVQLVAATIMAIVGLAPGDVSGGHVHLRDVVLLCVLELLMFAGAATAVHLRGGFRTLALDVRGRRQARGWLQLAPVGLVVIGPSVLAAFASSDPVIAHMRWTTGAAFVVLAIIIAATEELWFRGLVMSSLDPVLHPWASVVGSAVLFGLPHLVSSDSGVTAATALNATAVTLAIAIPFACVRVTSRAIVPMVGWHAAVDAWAFLHTSSITAEGSPDIGDAVVALALPVIIAASYLIWLSKRQAGRAHSTL